MKRPIVPTLWRASFTAALLAAAMLLSHPYTGIRHDGILYFGDALTRLVAGELHNDLYFFYGSQGRFTLLPAGYAELLESFGVGAGTIIGLLFAFCLQIGATLYVVAKLVPARLRLYSGLSVLVGWSIYGGLRVFSYGEGFLTARSVAEPLVLIALGSLIRGRMVAGLVCLLVAMAVHPLVGIGGLVVGWLWMCRSDRRFWLAVPVAAVAYVIVGVIAGGPFDGMFARYDETWFALVLEANPQAFIGAWRTDDFGSIAFSCIVLWLAARRIDADQVRSIATAALIGALLCSFVSFVAVDVLHNPFFGKLQIWRALWLTQWFAMALFPLVADRLWARGEAGRIAALLLAIGWMAPFSIAPPIVAVMALFLERSGDRIALTRTTTRIVAVLVVLIGVIIIGQYGSRAIKLGLLLDQPWQGIAGQLLSLNLIVVVLVVAAYRASLRRAIVGVAMVGVLVVLAVGFWDQRSPWTRRLESYPLGSNIWPGVIEPAARVYWYRDLIAPWILLGHANYYTQQQGSGAVFSRNMTIELDKRRKLTAILDFQEQICRMMNGLNEKANSCEPDVEAVRAVCVDGNVDYIVLQSGLDGAKAVASFATGVVENGYEKKFFLYRCSALNPR